MVLQSLVVAVIHAQNKMGTVARKGKFPIV
jgi:hypothetical protein